MFARRVTQGAGVLAAVAAATLAAASMSAPAMAQDQTRTLTLAQTNPCLALATDAERLICMRDMRAAEQAGEAQAAAARAAAEAQVQAQAQSQAQPRAQAASAAAPSPASAAPGAASSSAAACLALPTDPERLACMQDALAAAESALAAQQGGGGGGSDSDGGFLGLGIFGGGNRANALVASQSEFASGLGAEQVADRTNTRAETENDPRVSAAIVSYREYVPGRYRFELDNGQVWRQTNADTQTPRLRGRDTIPVEMWGSWTGGYRMRLVEPGQTLMVERLQ